jgi:hypothetical protein
MHRTQLNKRARKGCLLGALTLALSLASNAAFADAPVQDPAPQHPFAANSVWNVALPADAPLVANSAALVGDLVQKVNNWGPWIDSWSYSYPVYSVPANQPTHPVLVDPSSAMYTDPQDAATLSLELSAVPIPFGARPADGTDHHLVIWQPSTDTAWEMWQARELPTPTGVLWHAAWGVRLDHVSSGSGFSPYPFGATASGASVLGGLITAQEVQNRQIRHALAMSIPEPAAGRFVWPANRTDGTSTSPSATPEGTHLRLDPKLNIAALGLSPLGTAIALAAQRYGVIVRDRGNAVSFYAEDPNSIGVSYYNWGNWMSTTDVLARFPWTRFQVVAPQPTGATITAPATPQGTAPASTSRPSAAGSRRSCRARRSRGRGPHRRSRRCRVSARH